MELGLQTCVGVNSAKGQDSSVGGGAVVKLPWRCPHGRRGSGQNTGRSGKRRARSRRDTRKRTRRGTEREQTINQPLTKDNREHEGDAHKHVLAPYVV